MIPRPETADITSRLCEALGRRDPTAPLKILDICTGTGCIPLMIAHLLDATLAEAWGVDISGEAVSLAKENATALGMQNVKFVQVDLFDPSFASAVLEAAGDKFDVITANPPYIPRLDWQQLPESVRLYEDPCALLGDLEGDTEGKGLTFYRRIASLLPELLSVEQQTEDGGFQDRPRVMLEVGSDQANDVADILRSAGYSSIDVWQDQYGKDRAVVAR